MRELAQKDLEKKHQYDAKYYLGGKKNAEGNELYLFLFTYKSDEL